MTASRWWMLAVLAASAIAAVVLALGTGFGTRFWAGVAVLVVFLVLWRVVARPEQEEDGGRAALVTLLTIAAAASLTALDANLAFFQAIAFPAIWTSWSRLRTILLANALLAIAVAAGFVIRLGFSVDSIVLAITIEAISLGFSIAMGVWITRIARLSAERGRLLDELTRAQDELAVLHRDRGAIAERERLARELHDTTAQTLTGLVLLGQRARRELAAGTLDDATLELVESSAREALAETRSLVAATARIELPGGGIAEALDGLATRFARETGIAVTTRSTLSAPLDRDVEVVLLRCAQEGLANVRKHAGAHAARIELTADDGSATVRVVDDGHGFDPATAAAGFGLSGLRDRLALVGGELTIDGAAGATTLTARVPRGAAA